MWGKVQELQSIKESTFEQTLGKTGLVKELRGQILSREMILSSVFGVAVVLGMKIIESIWLTFGFILAIFLLYYILTMRKGKLDILGSGSLSYYTKDYDKQVVRLKYYDREGIKREIFSYGVLNIIYLQLVGMVTSGIQLSVNGILIILVTVLGYLYIFNKTYSTYGKKVEKEITYSIDNYNKGITIALTDEEKIKLKSLHGIKEEDTVEEPVEVEESGRVNESATDEESDIVEEPVTIKEPVEVEESEPIKDESSSQKVNVESAEPITEDEPITSEELDNSEEDTKTIVQPKERYGKLSVSDEARIKLMRESRRYNKKPSPIAKVNQLEVSPEGSISTKREKTKTTNTIPKEHVPTHEELDEDEEDLLDSIHVITDVKMSKYTNKLK